jgi:hypothetical protein
MKTEIKNFTGLLFLTFSFVSFAQTSNLCLDNPDDYYFSLRNISSENNFDISNPRIQLELKEALTNQIVTEIQIVSSSNLTFNRNGNDFSESEVFNSFSQSNSNAILFNPMYKVCSDSKFAIVYIKKSNFDNLAINYFKSLTRRIDSNLDIYNKRLETNPDYEFKNELIGLLRGLKTLDSYFGLMNSLDVEESTINDYLDLDVKIKTFEGSVNSLENNIIEARSLISNNNFTRAYDLLTDLKIRYPKENRLKPILNNYNDFVRIARKEELKDLKTISSSNNYLSLSFGFNTEFQNSNTSANQTSEYLSRYHPNLQGSFIFNNRNKTLGWGFYSKYHIASTNTFDNYSSEYEYPFSDNFLEAGIVFQWYIFANPSIQDYYQDQDEGAFAFSVHAGRYLNNFISNSGEQLNFISFSPGLEYYFNNKRSRSQRSSMYIRNSWVSSNSIYNYSSTSIGFTINIKSGRKLTEEQKEDVENEFRLIN